MKHDTNLAIEDQPYYHGLLPREDIRVMLQRNGEFLVRMTEPTPGQPRCYVLSMMFDETRAELGLKHFIIRRRNSSFVLRQSFESVPKLIDHFLTKSDSLSSDLAVIIKKPVNRCWWELSHSDIKITKKLGEGAFGEVSMGTLNVDGKTINVAIKSAKLEAMTKEQIKEVMTEARLMRMFDHPNVIKIYGVAAGHEPLMIVMELADKGALNSYLQKNSLPVKVRMEMCMGAAWGIEYLHEKNVIHRDIAARNCLYGDNRVKISDFGMTREGTVYEMDPHQRVPIRWLAPETIRFLTYTQKSDVYSFGVLCWEILMHGREPYTGCTVAETSLKIRDGIKLQLPVETPHDMMMLIEKHIWTDVNNRWSMKQITRVLEHITKLPRPQLGGVNGSQAREKTSTSKESRRADSRHHKSRGRRSSTEFSLKNQKALRFQPDRMSSTVLPFRSVTITTEN